MEISRNFPLKCFNEEDEWIWLYLQKMLAFEKFLKLPVLLRPRSRKKLKF